MATLKFFTRQNSKTEKLSTIYCRLKDGRETDLTVKSGLQIRADFFNNKTGTIRNKAEFTGKDKFEKKLRDLKNHIFDNFTSLNEPPTKQWLIETIDKKNNPEKHKKKEHNLFSFIRDFIDKAPTRITKTGRPVCYKQIREYERTFYYLEKYATAKQRKIDFKDVDLNFYYDFVEYLQSLKLAQNTIGKKIQTLKIFLNAATDRNLNVNRQFKSHRFTAISEETESIYLNENELEKINKLDLSKDKRLDKIRDLFLIGCWTGLRFSDWDKVTKENIKDDFLELKQQKTGGAVVIPLHPIVTKIMVKYNGKLPELISCQKFNDYLKEVAKKAKLNDTVHKSITRGGIKVSKAHKKYEMVTTHTGRRSFATNLYKAGLPTLSIMQITGHRTEKAFLKYIKVTPREHAEKLRTFWQDRVKLKVV
jgi:site-specific recombinase XerD